MCVGNSGVHRHDSHTVPGLREPKRVCFDSAIRRAGAACPMGILTRKKSSPPPPLSSPQRVSVLGVRQVARLWDEIRDSCLDRRAIEGQACEYGPTPHTTYSSLPCAWVVWILHRHLWDPIHRRFFFVWTPPPPPPSQVPLRTGRGLERYVHCASVRWPTHFPQLLSLRETNITQEAGRWTSRSLCP